MKLPSFIPDIRALVVWISVCIVMSAISAIGSWYATSNHVTAKYEARIAKDALAVEQELTRLTEAKAKADKDLLEARSDIDKEYRDEINRQKSIVARLTADDVSLRDPGERPRQDTCTGNPGETRGSDETSSGEGILSNEATGFLLGFAATADDTLEQLRACRAWSEKLETVFSEWNETLKKEPEKKRR